MWRKDAWIVPPHGMFPDLAGVRGGALERNQCTLDLYVSPLNRSTPRPEGGKPGGGRNTDHWPSDDISIINNPCC